MSKHLLYHVFPVTGNGIWQWNVAELKKRLPLFDGKRVCAIVTQKTRPLFMQRTNSQVQRDFVRVPLITDPAEMVIEELKSHGFEFIVKENDPNLGEVNTFEELFSRVQDYRRPDDCTLYAHARSVTRTKYFPTFRHTELLYETMLDYWPLVEEELQMHPTVGSFLIFGEGWPADSESQWHYSGSWFWFKNTYLFNQPDWKRIDNFWSGIESYPSLHFTESEASTVFLEGDLSLQMYMPDKLADINAKFKLWKAENINKRTDFSFPESFCPVI